MRTLQQLKHMIEKAHQDIAPYILQTPLKYSDYLSKKYQANIYLKLENIQQTSSFKIRGAFNKLLNLTEQEKAQGIITASTGNHAAGIATACEKLNITGSIVVPNTISPSKLNKLKQFSSSNAKNNNITRPVQLISHGNDGGEAESYARTYADKHHLTYVSPYNDIDVIAGQGTIGLEINNALPKVEQVYVSVGGGGLISGISSYLKSVNSKINIIGCQPENDAAMYESIQAGKIIALQNAKPTISDGTAGNIDLDSITFDYCKNYVDQYMLATEKEIIAAIKILFNQERLVTEGAAALTLASLELNKQNIKNKNIVLVLCGGNISADMLKKAI